MADKWTQAGFTPVKAPPPNPIEQKRRLEPIQAQESINASRISQAQGVQDILTAPVQRARAQTQLEIERETSEAQKRKIKADAEKAELERRAKERSATREGALPEIEGASETRTRIGLGLGPAIQAEKNMTAEERWRRGSATRNPFNASLPALAAKLLEAVPLTGLIGGEEFQRYQQAAKSWESAFLPIFSGQQVTPTEAARQIKARLPAADDTPQNLARKSLERRMMSNGAADLMGQPRPFPDVGVFYPTPGTGQLTTRPPPGLKTGASAPRAAAPKALPSGMTPAGARAQAKAAIAAGKPRAAVLQRLKELGVDTTGL